MQVSIPKVTVLMSVHNGEEHLSDSIDSILNQTFEDFEFLIINDASDDRSPEIIKSYKDHRIVLLSNEQNLGLTESLNRRIRLAKGEFIARQDADDISEHDRLEKQVLFLKAIPKLCLSELGTRKLMMRERSCAN